MEWFKWNTYGIGWGCRIVGIYAVKVERAPLWPAFQLRISDLIPLNKQENNASEYGSILQEKRLNPQQIIFQSIAPFSTTFRRSYFHLSLAK